MFMTDREVYMNFKEVSPEKVRKNPFQLIGKEWGLITAGNKDKVNAMTVSWGGLGVMYGKNVAFLTIRPQRYTKEFLDNEETFSLSFYDKGYRPALDYLGSVTGRLEDKISNSGLTVVYDDNTPYFSEANLVFICKKLYVQTMDGNCIIDKNLASTWYPNNDYHILYIAEIIKAMKETR
jgi:flavin reductase (DIM6/NTAB) family NADH-FMN oxidoreductase RutF